ncbi:hypothetical protein POM88_011175 [Heracleum sosnowskyi]|uniref:Transposase MuDR plant domain-containing protein n=1 Tax=Heracleum sosnowskyi TaxID=360622 RepID=A0AAD8N0J5_9APIA|nr:hypothetical protein POM88_011175 [Heracleum sosnowskyi]
MDIVDVKLNFVKSTHVEYVGGKVKDFQNFDLDIFSYFELIDLVKEVSVKEIKNSWFKPYDKSLDQLCVFLKDDSDVIKMLEYGCGNSALFELYFEHVEPKQGSEEDMSVLQKEIYEIDEHGDFDNDDDIESDNDCDNDIYFDEGKYDSSDENRMCLDELEDEGNFDAIMNKNEQYDNDSIPGDHIEFSTGMKFANHRELRHAIKSQAIAKGYDVVFEKSELKRMLVTCRSG